MDEGRRPKKISVANQKGGVGKTTTSVNLAASLAASGHKTLLIDLDPQGNASSGLGIDRHTSSTIYDVLIGRKELLECMQDSPLENLKVIPSNQNLIGAEVELINAISREKKLKSALKKVPQDFGFIIFDCPPSLGLLTINAFTASDSLLIPIQCEYYAMEGLGQLLNTYQIVKEDLNEDLQIEGILLTMFDPRNKLTHEVVREMEQHFPNELLKSVIPRNVKLSEAPSFGKPVLLYDLESKGAIAYMKLTEEILERNQYPAPDWSSLKKPLGEEEQVSEQLAVDQKLVSEADLKADSAESHELMAQVVPASEEVWKSPYALERASEIPQGTIQTGEVS